METKLFTFFLALLLAISIVGNCQSICKLLTIRVRPNQVQNVFETNGYYTSYTRQNLGIYDPKTRLYDFSKNILDTIFYSMIFYKKGFFANHLTFTDNDSYLMRDSIKNIEKYLDLLPSNKTIADKFYKHSYWGVYAINNDTLIVQSMVHGNSVFGNYNEQETYYKIIDKQTIQCIGGGYLRTGEKYWNRNPNEGAKANFVPYANIPPPEKNWLYQKKWIWRK